MIINIITLFPKEMKEFFLKGIFKSGYEKGMFGLNFVDLRKFGKTKHTKVDDYPFGLRKGMILRADVILDAVKSIENYKDYRILYTCPKGDHLNQRLSSSLSKEKKGLIIIIGYYKGVDSRLFDILPIQRISLG